MPVRILLQTAIPAIEDDWNVDRFSLWRGPLYFFAGCPGINDDYQRIAPAGPTHELMRDPRARGGRGHKR
jgi:hypothetical protein